MKSRIRRIVDMSDTESLASDYVLHATNETTLTREASVVVLSALLVAFARFVNGGCARIAAHFRLSNKDGS